MSCTVNNCTTIVTSRSKSNLCKLHYGYLWKSLNKEKVKAASKRVYFKNKEYYIKSSAISRTKQRKSNLTISLRDSLRRRFNNALKNNQKSGSAVFDLGCSIDEFRVYMESKFQSGMTWGNWSKTGWHIDHIRPLASFNLSDREELLKACHYSNLQPLWAKDNLVKADSYEI